MGRLGVAPSGLLRRRTILALTTTSTTARLEDRHAPFLRLPLGLFSRPLPARADPARRCGRQPVRPFDPRPLPMARKWRERRGQALDRGAKRADAPRARPRARSRQAARPPRRAARDRYHLDARRPQAAERAQSLFLHA